MRDFLPQPLFIKVLLTSIVITILIVGARFHQKNFNYRLLETQIDNSLFFIDIYETHHVSFIQKFEFDTDWSRLLSSPSLDNKKELEHILKLIYNYRLFQAEIRYLNAVKAKKGFQDLYSRYMYTGIIPSFKVYKSNNMLQWARYRAQQFINRAYNIEPHNIGFWHDDYLTMTQQTLEDVSHTMKKRY